MIIIFGSILPFSNEKVARYYVYNIDAIRSTVKSITQRAYSKKQSGDQLETYAPPCGEYRKKNYSIEQF